MYWEETKPAHDFIVPDDVVDLAFGIACRCLPVDHLHALARAVHEALPWFAAEPWAGLHPIHVADSGNGWMRPENPEDLLYLSGRTRLVLRLSKERVADARTLIGRTLDVGGHPLRVERATVRPLSVSTTIFSRYVVAGEEQNEQGFIEQAVTRLQAAGIRPKKLLCGKERFIRTPPEAIRTRSLMLAELELGESIALQQRGLGPLRQLGCGLFIPHKDIAAVKSAVD